MPQLQRDFELGNAVVDNKGIIYTLLSGAEDNKHDDPCKLVQIGHGKPVVTDITCNDKILLHGKLEIKEDNRLYFAALARDPGGKNLTGIFLTELADGKQAAPLSYTFTPELLRKVDKQDADQAISKGSKAGLLPFFEVVKIGKREDGSIDVLTAYTEYYSTTLMKDGRYNSIGNDNQRYYRLGDFKSILWACAANLSIMASARVGSFRYSYQEFTGS